MHIFHTKSLAFFFYLNSGRIRIRCAFSAEPDPGEKFPDPSHWLNLSLIVFVHSGEMGSPLKLVFVGMNNGSIRYGLSNIYCTPGSNF